MPESEKHNSLVMAILKYIENSKCSLDNVCFLLDSGLKNLSARPKPIDGYFPDLYAESLSAEKWVIIGEAKTTKDLDSRRSENQIKAFLKSCALDRDSSFVLAVPWDTTRYAKALLNQYIKQLNLEGVETIIINEFGF